MTDPSALSRTRRLLAPDSCRTSRSFVRFPTVSAQPRTPRDLSPCAALAGEHLRRIGLERRRRARDRRPSRSSTPIGCSAGPRRRCSSTATTTSSRPSRCTRGASPPFEPALRGEDLYGRGRLRRQGPAARPRHGDRGLPATQRPPARQRHVPRSRARRSSAARISPRSCGDHRGASRADVALVSDTRCSGARAARDHVRAARSALARARGARARVATCTPASSAARFTIRCRRFARSSRASRRRGGRIADPGLLRLASAPSPRASAVIHGARRARRRAAARETPCAARGWGEAGFTLYERTTMRPAL